MKQGDAAALRREARGARLAGPPLAPRVVECRQGALTSQWIPGRPRRLHRLDPDRAISLGRRLAQVHGRRATTSAGLPAWPGRVTSRVAYARARARDAMARARSGAERRLITDATHAAEAGAGVDTDAHPTFALLHGDLVEDNIVWPADGSEPVLVDWEFWRMGDPAEDLAYLIAINDLPPEVAGRVFMGYGADWPMMARVDLWIPLVLADAGLWLRAHGDPGGGDALLDRARDTLDG